MGIDKLGNCPEKIEFVGRRKGHSQFSLRPFKTKTRSGSQNNENKKKYKTMTLVCISSFSR